MQGLEVGEGGGDIGERGVDNRNVIRIETNSISQSIHLNRTGNITVC